MTNPWALIDGYLCFACGAMFVLCVQAVKRNYRTPSARQLKQQAETYWREKQLRDLAD